MNAVACLLVILIHVLSLGVSQADPTAWQAAAIYIPWKLAAFVVPMFLYTGAVKLAGQYGGRKISPGIYLRYLLRRLRKIYVPYAVWVAVYYLYFLRIRYVEGSIREFVSYLLLGNLSSPFYYIVTVMQFYALMPLWVWMLEHVRPYAAVIAGLLVTFCMGQLAAVLSHFGIAFLYTDRIFPTYLVFWVAGLYVGKRYDAFAPTVREPATCAVCAAGVAVCCAIAYWQYACGLYIFNVNSIKPFADLLSIILVHAVSLKSAQSGGLCGKLLDKVYQASFFVYLSHCLFLHDVTRRLQDAGVTELSVLLPVRFAVCYTVPFLLYFALRRLGERWKSKAKSMSKV